MVIVDIDHPDIETFIDWKVIEEQKVAALVAGSKLTSRHLNLIMKACREGTDPAENPALKHEIRAARRAMIPESYIQRVIQLARQGETAIDFKSYDTDWDSGGLSDGRRAEFEQFGALVERLSRAHRSRRVLGLDPANRRQDRQDLAGARAVGPYRPCRLGVGRSRPAIRHDDQRMAHLRRERPDQRLQSVFRIQFPRRHGLQPRLVEFDGVPPER